MVSHWVRYDTDEPFIPNLDKFGFVYLITKIQNGKAYVGCKQYFVGKTKKQMKWKTYTGSSKYLNADIEKDGKEKFKFEVIAEYKNKRSLHYYEAYYQMKWDVLTATLKDSDEQAFYNGYVGGKWYRPIESFEKQWSNEENIKRMSELGKKFGKINGKKNSSLEYVGRTGHPRYIGKCKVVFKTNEKKIKILDGKEVTCYKDLIVDNLTHFCRENNYNKGRTHVLILGYFTFNGTNKYKLKTGELRQTKRRRILYKCNRHKDIIKVILLDKEKNEEAQLRIKECERKYKEETDNYDNNITEEEKKIKKLNMSKAQKLNWKNMSEEHRKKMKTGQGVPKSVLCTLAKPTGHPQASTNKFIETGKKIKFKSITDAKKFGYDIGNISAVGTGRRRSVGGNLGYIIKVEYLQRKEETNVN